MEALANLGIDWKLFLAQAINFLVLLFILKRYAYRPMLEFLEKRTERIEKGLKDAEAAGVKLKAIEEEEKKVLGAARAEARNLLNQAEEAAKARETRRMAETEEKAGQFLAEAESRIEEEKQKMLAEAKREIAETVVLAVEKILKEKVDSPKDAELIARILK